jgi:hypothetical protein
MNANRVAELSLRIHASAECAPELESRVRRFTRDVLERCADLIEARAPRRLWFVRRLPLRWRLTEEALNSASAVDRCASDAAEAIQHAARHAVRPSPDDDLAVFDDEAHWRVAHLIDRLHGAAGAWYHTALESGGDPIEALSSPGRRDLARAVLCRLLTEDRLTDVLSTLSPATAAALADSLGLFEMQPELQSVGVGLHSGTSTLEDRTAPGYPPGEHRGSPSDPLVLLTLYARIRARLGPTATEDALRVALAESLAAHSRSIKDPAAAPLPGEAATDVPGLHISTVQALPASIRPQDAPADLTVESRNATLHRTRFGGLFYLLNCALELDLGETLWRACLPEGDVLAQATAALLGRGVGSDPAPWLFGGVEPGRAWPTVGAAAQQEVAALTTAAIAAALPRRGLARLPEIVLDLWAHAHGRLLVAAEPVSPFVLCAWPASTPEEVDQGIRAFLGAWPRGVSATLARPALAELDRSARLRPSRHARVSPALLVPDAPTAVGAALSAQVAGVLCALFAARAGAPAWPDALTFVERFLAVPARVVLTEEDMTVTLAAADVELSVRRAGLDRDPGWIPWLQRSVRLSFDGSGGEAES